MGVVDPMFINVLTIPSEYESAVRLGYPTFLERFTLFDNQMVVRWGNSRREGKPDYEKKYLVNPAKAIRRNCNKHEALKRLAKVVNVPSFCGPRSSWLALFEPSVLLLRPIEHTNGEGFTIAEVRKGEQLGIGSEQYATKWIKTDKEYRVWFAFGNTLVARRVPIEDHHRNQEYPCRSDWGYRFLHKSRMPRLHAQTLLAAQAIGLQTGAADVLCKDGRYYFLELNSAPSVDDPRITRFFKKHIDAEYKRRFTCLA